MIKPEQIPQEVLDAFRIAFWVNDGTESKGIAAALNAWPGMRDSQHVSFDGRVENAIVLPLPARSANA